MTDAATSALSPTWSLPTDRLVIHHFQPTQKYADFLLELYNSPLFIAGEGDIGINNAEKAMKNITGFVASQFAKNGHGPYVISLPSTDDGENFGKPVGIASLMRGHYTAPDVGFALLLKCTGKGYAQEAGKALMAFAVRSTDEGGLGYPGVFGFTSPTNAKSRKVCESLGLEFRGVYPLEAFGGKPSAVFAMPRMSTDLSEYGVSVQRSD